MLIKRQTLKLIMVMNLILVPVMILLILHWMGSASTYVFENLAQVVLTQEDLEGNNAYCAAFRMRLVLRRK